MEDVEGREGQHPPNFSLPSVVMGRRAIPWKYTAQQVPGNLGPKRGQVTACEKP